MYDFATGNTNPETFPADALVAAAARAIPAAAVQLNRYPGKQGHEGLRALMARRESEREGVQVDPEHIALTNGSMQGVTLVAETFCRQPGDIVLMEEFNYSGTIKAYNALGITIEAVPQDGAGMRTDELARIMERLHAAGTPPRFIYTLATYQNPTGAVMPVERRRELLDIAKRYDTLVVEDNCYADVHFEGDKPPALYALDDAVRQIYLCSLSKIFAPGVRLGYLLAKPPILDEVLARRHDAGPNTLSAAIVTEYLGDDLWAHCEMANRALKVKRDAMLAALDEHVGNLCSWSRPVGGLFLWLRLPDDVDLGRLAALALERGVEYADGDSFHVHADAGPHIRLAFGFPPEETIREGVRVLAGCIRDARAEAAP